MKYVYEGVELKATLKQISVDRRGREATVRKSSRSRELTFAVLADLFFCHGNVRPMDGGHLRLLNRPRAFCSETETMTITKRGSSKIGPCISRASHARTSQDIHNPYRNNTFSK